jgi:hypothetical protein
MMGTLLCDKQVVALCPGLSIHTLRAARTRPNLNAPPCVRVGGRVRYPIESVVAWARANGIALSGPRKTTVYDAK